MPPLPDRLKALPAFPGAQGHGSKTPGGRGGAILFVTNTKDKGAGSLREALTAKGPRIVIVKTGGTVRLSSGDIRVDNPYLTLFCQTAPGDGLQLRDAGIVVRTHDVIIRGCKVRPGDVTGVGSDPFGRDGVEVSGNAYDVILDHNSIAWSVDENTNVRVSLPTRVTFSWNIIAEGLMNSIHPEGRHSMGMLVEEDAEDISIHHNLFAHNWARNPRVLGKDIEIINNVIYNWGSAPNENDHNYQRGVKIFYTNVIGNFFKSGQDTRRGVPKNRSIWISDKLSKKSKLYVRGNASQYPSGSIKWDSVYEEETGHLSEIPVAHQSGITVQTASEAYDLVLQYAGAQSLQQISLRDSVDQRIVDSVKKMTGRIIDSPADVGGYPNLASGTYPADTDKDGIPDIWESTHGLNPNKPADASQLAPTGYMWIEAYANSLIPIASQSSRSQLPYRR